MKLFLTVLLCLALVAGATAQPATPAQMSGVKPDQSYGTLHLRTRLGSFKIIQGEGRVEIDFIGTVMVSRLKGTFVVTGDVRKEYDKNERTIYHGRGRAVVTGSWRAVQWFGRDMTGVWYGKGLIRLAGEFDRNQQTGEYWFNDPKDIQYWPGSTTYDITNPQPTPGQNPNVRVRKKGQG